LPEQCELAAGNQYFVDPVNGSDSIGTGSGKAGGAAMAKCAFRTLTRAMRWIGDNPPSGTTITNTTTRPGAKARTRTTTTRISRPERSPRSAPARC